MKSILHELDSFSYQHMRSLRSKHASAPSIPNSPAYLLLLKIILNLSVLRIIIWSDICWKAIPPSRSGVAIAIVTFYGQKPPKLWLYVFTPLIILALFLHKKAQIWIFCTWTNHIKTNVTDSGIKLSLSLYLKVFIALQVLIWFGNELQVRFMQKLGVFFCDCINSLLNLNEKIVGSRFRLPLAMKIYYVQARIVCSRLTLVLEARWTLH